MSQPHRYHASVPDLGEGGCNQDALCRLGLAAQGPQKLLHLRAKAPVKHGVCFIKDHILYIAVVDVALLSMLKELLRGCYQDVQRGCKCSGLLCICAT